jgi:hypothetical protein
MICNCAPNCTPYTASDSATIQVLVPAALVVLPDSKVIPTSWIGTCTDQAWGIALAIHYQVVDVAGIGIPSVSMEPQELAPGIGLKDWSDVGPSKYPGTSPVTDPNGQFLDAPNGFCNNNGPFKRTDTQYMRILLHGRVYNIRTNYWTASSSFPGHGSQTNGVDISFSH